MEKLLPSLFVIDWSCPLIQLHLRFRRQSAIDWQHRLLEFRTMLHYWIFQGFGVSEFSLVEFDLIWKMYWWSHWASLVVANSWQTSASQYQANSWRTCYSSLAYLWTSFGYFGLSTWRSEHSSTSRWACSECLNRQLPVIFWGLCSAHSSTRDSYSTPCWSFNSLALFDSTTGPSNVHPATCTATLAALSSLADLLLF